jgi:hypothetical protein
MCENCGKLQKQLDYANNYYGRVMDLLGELAKVAGIRVKAIAKLDALAVIKKITAAYKASVEKKIAAYVETHTEEESKLAALPEAWRENLAWIEQTEFEPADIDRVVELLALLGFSGARLQYVLAATDMAQALEHCGYRH